MSNQNTSVSYIYFKFQRVKDMKSQHSCGSSINFNLLELLGQTLGWCSYMDLYFCWYNFRYLYNSLYICPHVCSYIYTKPLADINHCSSFGFCGAILISYQLGIRSTASGFPFPCLNSTDESEFLKEDNTKHNQTGYAQEENLI